MPIIFKWPVSWCLNDKVSSKKYEIDHLNRVSNILIDPENNPPEIINVS